MRLPLFRHRAAICIAWVTIVSGSLNQAVALTITNQPRSLTILGGSSATFTVGPSGQAPFQFQWRFDGAPIAGATTNPLVLPNIQTNQAGSYSVAVSDAADSTVSSNALLTVLPFQFTKQPQSQFALL